MPQFVVIARDAKDEGALERRLAVREAHIKACDLAVETGQQIYRAALLSEDGKMCGSVMVFEMESRAVLDDYLKNEPYVTNKVWGEIEIIPCKTGPSFTKFLPQ